MQEAFALPILSPRYTPPSVVAVERTLRLLPPFVGSRLINATLRGLGVRVGRSASFWGVPRFRGNPARYLTIGERCGLNVRCTFELDAPITLEGDVSVGMDVIFRASAPIHVGAGSWIGAKSVIGPGVRIGAGSVIGAGSIIFEDVPDNVLLVGARRVSLARWRG